MPTVITHAIVGIGGSGIAKSGLRSPRLWILAMIVSILPDADTVGFYLGVPYGNLSGHRGLFHSLFFAFITSIIVVAMFYRDRRELSGDWWKLVILFFLICATHGILDAFTDGGLGIALFAPFDNTRYFFPFRPIQVAPLGFKGLFSDRGLQVMISEALWIWIPLILAVVITRLARLRKQRPR